MAIEFRSLVEADFILLQKWLSEPHILKGWGLKDKSDLAEIKEKYYSYTQGYKITNGQRKNIYAYVVFMEKHPIGYIQYYNVRDFPREGYQYQTNKSSVAGLDFYIGEIDYLRKGLSILILNEFINTILFKDFSEVFVDPAFENKNAFEAFSKVGFKVIRSCSDIRKYFMIKGKQEIAPVSDIVLLNQLACREPIFHHPDKFGTSESDIEQLMCEDFFEIGASGREYNRADVLSTLLERYQDAKYQDQWEAFNFRVTKISHDTYLLNYHLLQDKTRLTQRSTIWKLFQDCWKIFYHQGTIMRMVVDE